MNALILIGGKSSRMGTDKSKLIYHEKKQTEHTFDLLSEIIPKENVYFSVNNPLQITNQQTIVDLHPNLGPFGAIYSAFSKKPHSSWLVLAIDIPLINKYYLNKLIKKRDLSKIATTYKGFGNKHPEPLIAIWEPKSFSILQEGINVKNYSLMRILKNNPIKTILIENKYIENINTKDAYKLLKKTSEGNLNNSITIN